MSQNRQQLEQDLLAYVEGRLTPDERARIEIHLANTDPALARQIAGMMDDRLALQSLPALSAPSDLSDRIMAQVERQTLIGGVERQLVTEPRRWFQTRLAIAAGLLIVVGGFGFWVLGPVLHKNSEWQPWALDKHAPVSPPLAVDESKHNDVPAKTADVPAPVHGGDLAIARNEDKPVAAAPAIPAATRIAAAAATVDPDTRLNDLLKKGRRLASGNLDPAEGGYLTVSSPRDALSLMEVAQRGRPDNSPLVMTLVAREPEDIQRLKDILAADADVQSADDKASTPSAPLSQQPQIAAGAGGAGGAGGGRGGGRAARAGGGGGAGGAGAAGFGGAAPGGASQQKTMRAVPAMAPDTYHIRLRPDQIEQLSQSFALSSVARGTAAYNVAAGGIQNMIAPKDQNGQAISQGVPGRQAGSQEQQDATAAGAGQNSATLGNNLSQNSNLNNLSNGSSNGLNGSTAFDNQNNQNRQLNNNYGSATSNNDQARNTTALPAEPVQGSIAPITPKAAEPSAGAAKPGAKDAPLIDCVITIVSQPAAATLPAKN